MTKLEELLEKENLRNTPFDVFLSLRDNIKDVEILEEICSNIDFDNTDSFFSTLKSFLVSYGEKLSVMDGETVARQIVHGKKDRNSMLKTTESIIQTINRPAFLIRNNQIESSIETRWKKRLDDCRANLNLAIPSVGRVEIDNHPYRDWVGTAWLIKGTDILVTNRHVAYAFASRQDESFDINQNAKGRKLKVSIDFKEEYNVDVDRTYRIKKVVHIAENDEPDIALMQVHTISYDGYQLPEGLEIEYHEIEPEKEVCTIGYPGIDSLSNQTKEMKDVFMDIYDVKRLAPGLIYPSAAAEFIYQHDCSTWYGNSGSPILDLHSGKVVGIHYAGSKVEYGGVYTNWAVRSTYLIELLTELKMKIPS